MAKTHKVAEEKVEESKETVAGVIAAVAFLIFACALFGFLLVGMVSGVYGWWTAPQQINTERLLEIAKLCGEMGAGVEWIDGTDGLYRDVRCQGE